MNNDLDKIREEVKKCDDVLKAGGIIIYPTDTIWGLGCDATNESAVEKIYRLKQREDTKSMIILVAYEAMLESYVRDVPEPAWELIEYSEQPLTLVLDGARNLAKNLVAGDGSIGMRITKDEFCKRLIEKFRKPIVSTSANISGGLSPQNFSQITDEIKQGVDYVVDLYHEETTKKSPSRIIKMKENGEIKILR